MMNIVSKQFSDEWTDLAAAIVGQACRDYLHALVLHYRHPEKQDPILIIRSCEKFFRSAWFGVLCNLDASLILNELRIRAIKRVERRAWDDE